MATKVNFNGQLRALPGAYSQIKSGIVNPPAQASFGNVLIIDTDATSTFGGGAGINGAISNGEDAVYSFDNIRDFRNFVGGGKMWDLAAPLFRPFGVNSQGVSTLYYVRSLTTTAAEKAFTLTNGAVTFQVLHEGLVGNGAEVSSVLTKGFAVTLEAGQIDSNKVVFKFWRGSYKGADANSLDYEGVAESKTTPTLITASPELGTIAELIAWTNKDVDFANNFKVKTSSITTTGALVAADITGNVGNQLFAGATQTNTASTIDDVLDVVAPLDFTHVLSIEGGANARSANNIKIETHLAQEARFDKLLVVAGGDDKSTFSTQSLTAASGYDSDAVIVIHGGCYENDIANGTGLKQKDAVHKAAYVLGRTVGLEPQTPATFKGLGYAGEIHKLTEREKVQALDGGVLVTGFDRDLGFSVIVQGITSIQENDNLVNNDGTTFSWQLKRIAAQLNKEIEINAKVDLLANQNAGPNRATLSNAVVKTWTENYLKSRTAKSTADNLIIGFENVVVTTEQDNYKIDYRFEPNFEVNKLFFTGLIIDPNIQ